MHNMPELKDVTWVSITCDPDNDTVEALRNYADRWEADPNRWLFCRADLDYTRRVARGMNLVPQPQDPSGLCDRHRQVRARSAACSMPRVRTNASGCAHCLCNVSKRNRPRRAWQPAQAMARLLT